MSTAVAMGVAVLISERCCHRCGCLLSHSCTLLPSTAAFTCTHLSRNT